MVRPGEPFSTAECMWDQFRRMGLSDSCLGSLTTRPQPGSQQAEALRLLIFGDKHGPMEATPWTTIVQRTFVRGWLRQDDSAGNLPIAAPRIREERRSGEYFVLVPRLPEDELFGFAWTWFLDMAALLDIYVRYDAECVPRTFPQITPRATFHYKWGVVNTRGANLRWGDGFNAGAEGLLLFAQHPHLLMNPFWPNGLINQPILFKGILFPNPAAGQQQQACLELFPCIEGGQNLYKVRLRRKQQGRQVDPPSSFITSKILF